MISVTQPSPPPGGTTEKPLISVVIPAYNAQTYLAQCLSSVRNQSGDFQLEILVVDDGSQDETASIAQREPGVKCIVQRNRGPSAARNTGMASATGEFIAFLDADDLWPDGKLQAQLTVLRRHPQAALVFGDCRQFNVDGFRPHTEFAVGSLGAVGWGDTGLVPNAYARLLEDNFITTGSVIVRRLALDEAGGFAEDLRLVEDLDLWLRIARRHAIAWCPVECLHRRLHESNISRDARAIGIAYLDVLSRHVASWGPGDDVALGVEATRLVSKQELHLAELAMSRGHARATWLHVWRGIASYPRPASTWRAAKTLLKLGARGLGLRD